MSIDLYQAGAGTLPLVYGKHLLQGILSEKSVNIVGNQSQVNLKVLLGYDEWEALDELSYEGVIIDGSNYTFHRGTKSTGANDPIQGADPRFPNSIYHSRVPYYSVTLPVGMASEDRPDKLRAFVRGLRVFIHDSNGIVVAFQYSTNPADVFVDLVRRNCIKLGLNYVDHIDWQAYSIAHAWYDGQIGVDDGKRTPIGIVLTPSSGSGSLPAGTYHIRICAIGANGQSSVGSRVRTTEVGASGRIYISWEPEEDAAGGYRVYFSNDSSQFNHFFTVGAGQTSFNLTETGTAQNGAIPTLPTGDWLIQTNRFECHRQFKGGASMVLADALTAVTFDGASKWVQDGKRYRILLPNNRPSEHTFTVSNTLPDKFDFYRVERRDRPNRISGTYRDRTSSVLAEIDGHSVNRHESQSKIGVVEEALNLGTSTPNEAERRMQYRLRLQHDQNQRCDLGSDGSAEHLLVGDVVTVIDKSANWETGKTFEIMESEDADSNSADQRNFRLWEYNPESYSDYDKTPLISTQPLEIPTKYNPPQAIIGMALSEQVDVNRDGAVNSSIIGSIQFSPSVYRQIGVLLHKQPDGIFRIIGSYEPNQTTQLAGFRIENQPIGEHRFKLIVQNTQGVEQTDQIEEYVVTVDGKDDRPNAPTAFTLRYDGNRIKGKITAPSDTDIKGYNIYSANDAFLFFTPSSEFDYGFQSTNFSLKAKSIDRSGNESLQAITAEFIAPAVSVGVLDKLDFALGNVRTVGSDIYGELNIIPNDADYQSLYLSIDAIRGVRVRTYNLFGDQVDEKTQGFTGRGQVNLGIIDRSYCDHVEQAVYSIEFLNSAKVWSNAVWWTNENASTNFWKRIAQVSWNGTLTPPNWRSRLHFPSQLSANPISANSVVLNWVKAPNQSSGNQSVFYRVINRGNARQDWNYGGAVPWNGTPVVTINNLSPNTEYEFMVYNETLYWHFSNVAIAKTHFAVYIPPPTNNPNPPQTVSAPTSLSATPQNQTSNLITWTTNETNYDYTDIYRDGVYLFGVPSSEANQYLDNGVTAGSTHSYKALHARSDGNGGYIHSGFSEEKTVTTPDNPPPTNNDPTNLIAGFYPQRYSYRAEFHWYRNSGGNGVIEQSTEMV